MTPAPPRRVVQLVEGFEELVVAAAQLARRAGAETFELRYEASYADVGADADPRGDEDPVRWLAIAGYVIKTRGRRPTTRDVIGVSADLPYAAPSGEHEEALTDAVAACLKQLGANVRIATLRGDR